MTKKEMNYIILANLSDYVAKKIAKRLHRIGSDPIIQNILNLGARMDWHELRPISEDSDTWEPTRENLRLYAPKVQEYYEQLAKNQNP